MTKPASSISNDAPESASTANPGEPAHGLRRLIPGLLSSLDNPGQVVGSLGPNWFASIMGTGIVANAAVTLPLQIPGQRGFAIVVWALDFLLLVALTIATVLHWVRNPEVARRHALDPVMANFYGAPPMALLSVGAGTLLAGKAILGTRLAVDIDWVLWITGTVTGLACTAIIPFLQFTRYQIRPDGAFGGWIMPIVPPMVSAATGALLVPYVPAGSGRATFLYGCYAMFGLSLIASLITITMIWSRLSHYGTSGTSRVPTLWIVLGPLGQSITAAALLGGVAHLAVAPPIATALSVMAILFGLPVFGFALLWATLAASITVRTARRKMPFALTWWSFTFPVGTCVTGTTGLAVHTGLPALRVAAAVFFVGLLVAWVTVATRTSRASLLGHIFLPTGSIQPHAVKG